MTDDENYQIRLKNYFKKINKIRYNSRCNHNAIKITNRLNYYYCVADALICHVNCFCMSPKEDKHREDCKRYAQELLIGTNF